MSMYRYYTYMGVKVYIYIHIYMHTHMYTYIFIIHMKCEHLRKVVIHGSLLYYLLNLFLCLKLYITKSLEEENEK